MGPSLEIAILRIHKILTVFNQGNAYRSLLVNPPTNLSNFIPFLLNLISFNKVVVGAPRNGRGVGALRKSPPCTSPVTPLSDVPTCHETKLANKYEKMKIDYL